MRNWGESTNWRRRANAKGSKAGPELARDAHEIEEREVSGLGRHWPQLPLPQHEPWRIRVPKYQVILESAVHLGSRTQPIQPRKRNEEEKGRRGRSAYGHGEDGVGRLEAVGPLLP
jgi:hypothetical protein